jgi:hypothetical protein
MNRYILIRRLRGPSILLLIGVLALLDKLDVIDHFWGLFWPLLLVMLGVFLLAERAALASEEEYPPPPYPGGPYPETAAYAPPPAGGVTEPGSAIVTTTPNDFGNGPNGGRQ